MSHFRRSSWRNMETQLQFSSASPPQTDGLNKAVNRIFRQFIKEALVENMLKQWDLHIEFACYNWMSRIPGKSPFEVVYWKAILQVLSILLDCPLTNSSAEMLKKRLRKIKQSHAEGRERILKQTGKYRHQAIESLLFSRKVISWKKRFPPDCHAKLSPPADGPFWVLERIRDNVYRTKVPGEFGISTIFNIAELPPYHDDQILHEVGHKDESSLTEREWRR